MKSVMITFLRFVFGTLAVIVGLWIAFWAILILAVLSDDTGWLLRFSGLSLAILSVLYFYPLRFIPSSRGLAFVGMASLLAALAYAVIYDRAEANDPFRSENAFGALHPFQTASMMCVIQIVRISFAFFSRRYGAPNHLLDPTSPSVTPPAGAGDAPSVAADH